MLNKGEINHILRVIGEREVFELRVDYCLLKLDKWKLRLDSFNLFPGCRDQLNIFGNVIEFGVNNGIMVIYKKCPICNEKAIEIILTTTGASHCRELSYREADLNATHVCFTCQSKDGYRCHVCYWRSYCWTYYGALKHSDLAMGSNFAMSFEPSEYITKTHVLNAINASLLFVKRVREESLSISERLYNLSRLLRVLKPDFVTQAYFDELIPVSCPCGSVP